MTTATAKQTTTKTQFTDNLADSITIIRQPGESVTQAAKRTLKSTNFFGQYGDCLFVGNTDSPSSFDGVYYHLVGDVGQLNDPQAKLIFTRGETSND